MLESFVMPVQRSCVWSATISERSVYEIMEAEYGAREPCAAEPEPSVATAYEAEMLQITQERR